MFAFPLFRKLNKTMNLNGTNIDTIPTVITQAGCIAAGEGRVFSRVCLSVCPRSKTKTAWAINITAGMH